MQYYKQHKKGIIGTFVFHAIILILLIFLGFFTPLPLPGEEGILVSFGDVESGAAQNNNIESTQQIQQSERETSPSIPQSVPNPPSTSRQETSREPVVTQNIEQTAVIDNTAEEARREEADRRQRQLEEERQRQAELENQRIAEAERIRREEQQRINEINSRTQNAFSNNGTGSSQQGDGTGAGVAFPEGNRGGNTDASNTNGYGQGNNSDGISYNLAGRSALSLPKPNYPGNDGGTVVVSVTVDKNGNVITAEPGVRGTTIMNRQFWNEAQQAALKAKFNINENSPVQQGTITYRFILQ